MLVYKQSRLRKTKRDGGKCQEAELEVTDGSPILLGRKVTDFLLCCPRVRGVTKGPTGMAAMAGACSSRCSQGAQPKSHPEMEVGAGRSQTQRLMLALC